MNKKLFLLPLLLSLGTISASEKKITVRADGVEACALAAARFSIRVALVSYSLALMAAGSSKGSLFKRCIGVSNAAVKCAVSSFVVAGGTMATANPSDTLTVSYKKEKSRPF